MVVCKLVADERKSEVLDSALSGGLREIFSASKCGASGDRGT